MPGHARLLRLPHPAFGIPARRGSSFPFPDGGANTITEEFARIRAYRGDKSVQHIEPRQSLLMCVGTSYNSTRSDVLTWKVGQ